jgi:Protein of unknown function (DUF3306)
MSEPENFLTRWSRRKREAEEAAEAPPATAAEECATKAEEVPEATKAPEGAPPEFDPATLPPVDSIGVETDITAFLQKGVPPDLTHAALRRAWTTDPVIRDFIGVAENQWDFATGSDIPGFGPLEIVDDVLRRVAAIAGGDREVVAHDAVGEPEPATEPGAHAAPEPSEFEDTAQPSRVLYHPDPPQELPPSQATPAGTDDEIAHRTNKNTAPQ